MTENTTVQQSKEAITVAADLLRAGLAALEENDYLRSIQVGRDEVYARYGRPNGLFAPDNLPNLTKEQFRSFLTMENNRHWSGIHRQGPRLTDNMELLRQRLLNFLDESRPLAVRYDEAVKAVSGLGRATATPILHVVYPEKYGVWNRKSEDGLRRLDLFPAQESKASEGQQYESVNSVLLQLAAELSIDLWTLDTLWEWMAMKKDGGALAPPFDVIFADRAQAEWAFDLFRKTVELLGGGPDDPRFALTLRYTKTMMRLNFGQWMVVDVSNSRGIFHITLLTAPAEAAGFTDRSSPFKADQEMSIFAIPIHSAQKMPDPLWQIYQASMERIKDLFIDWQGTPHKNAHQAELMAALFDPSQRDYLLAHGLQPGQRYWRITLPADARNDLSDGRGDYNFWADCLTYGIAAIDFEDQPDEAQEARFAAIRPGDRVVAFLRNRTIGGIGTVTSALDENLARERPPTQDYFRGRMWQRISVDWHAQEISVDALPKNVQNKFGTKTVLELTVAEFTEVEKLIIQPPPPPPTLSDYTFTNFSADTYLSADDAQELLDVLQRKKQLIFYGPPGTGKTYVADKLARLLTGLADPPPEQLEIVQFHPAYGYEEFIEGIRPKVKEGDGAALIDYPVLPGAFVRFCRAASRLGNAPCVFIIDEINRGNIPRIFGELMLLLEYRDKSVPLPYSGERFRIPPNVYLIGTMNTADRSIALVDFALRRRFHFFEFAADPDLFDRWLAAHPTAVPWLGALYRRLTGEAIDDSAFRIGPSVFMDSTMDETGLARVWRRTVIPYLREYYYDQPQRADAWRWDGDLLRVIRGNDGDSRA